jgi:uncharacterized protein (DUF2235 family)
MGRKINFLKRFKSSNFIGTQLSRFKMAMGYYALIVSTISAIMLVKTAYPSFEIEWIIMVFPVPVLITWIIGYYLDKKNINTMDSIKSNEMVHRFLMTSDLKAQEFQLMQTELLLNALKSMKDGTEIETNSIQEKYQEYVKKWKSPYQVSDKDKSNI